MRALFWLVVALGLALPAPLLGKAPPGPVDLNRATVVELMQLPGVGRHRAEAIVRARQARPFARPADLLRVKGFGRGTFRRLKPYILVTPRDERTPPTSGSG